MKTLGAFFTFVCIYSSPTLVLPETVKVAKINRLTTNIYEIATPLPMQELFEDDCDSRSEDNRNVSDSWTWGLQITYKNGNRTLPKRFRLTVRAPIKVATYSHEVNIMDTSEELSMNIELMYDQMCSGDNNGELKPITCGKSSQTVLIYKEDKVNSIPKLLTFCEHNIWIVYSNDWN